MKGLISKLNADDLTRQLGQGPANCFMFSHIWFDFRMISRCFPNDVVQVSYQVLSYVAEYRLELSGGIKGVSKQKIHRKHHIAKANHLFDFQDPISACFLA